MLLITGERKEQKMLECTGNLLMHQNDIKLHSKYFAGSFQGSGNPL